MLAIAISSELDDPGRKSQRLGAHATPNPPRKRRLSNSSRVSDSSTLFRRCPNAAQSSQAPAISRSATGTSSGSNVGKDGPRIDRGAPLRACTDSLFHRIGLGPQVVGYYWPSMMLLPSRGKMRWHGGNLRPTQFWLSPNPAVLANFNARASLAPGLPEGIFDMARQEEICVGRKFDWAIDSSSRASTHVLSVLVRCAPSHPPRLYQGLLLGKRK